MPKNLRVTGTNLLCPGMALMQGPALWVYNDAEFPADDFDRICTFAGCFSKRIHCANGHNVKEGGLMLILMLTTVMSQLGLETISWEATEK